MQLADLGFDNWFEEKRARLALPDCTIPRVTRVDRDRYLVRNRREDLCSSCGRCEEACSVKMPSMVDGQKVIHSAIHAPLPGTLAIPSAYYIEKNGVAACRAACPLGIKVQGFISLLSRGKVDEALRPYK